MRPEHARPALDRLMDMISPEPNTGCWLWLGAVTPKGYAVITCGSVVNGTRRTRRAHMVAYEQLHGNIPAGLQLDHKCRVKCCVNPDHLEPVPARINVMRSDNAASLNARKTHCKNGHPFNAENTGRWREHRFCIPCRKEWFRTHNQGN